MAVRSEIGPEFGAFSQLYEQTRLLYNFTNLMSVHTNHKNCTELAPELTMTEVHLLIDIMEYPGIKVSELGRMNKKTRGAISQMVSKLESSGMLTKSVNEQHGKKIDLNLTELGLAVARDHAASDVQSMTGTLNQLLKSCSMEEISHFYKVLQCYIDILQETGQYIT